MDKEYYGLNIEKDKIEKLSKILGVGNFKDSNICFFGNEEAINDYDNITEEQLNRKIDFMITNKGKKFSEININENLHPVYQKMLSSFPILNLDKCFIGELFFLPSNYGNDLYDTYLVKQNTEYNSRENFYKTNKQLYKLLKKRITNIKSNIAKYSDKNIFFYGIDKFKLDLLNSFFLDFDKIGTLYSFYYDDDKGKNVIIDNIIYSTEFKGNNIFLIPFLSKNFIKFDLYNEILKLNNNYRNKIYNKYINKYWFNSSDICDCGGIVMQKNMNDGIIFECINCKNNYLSN